MLGWPFLVGAGRRKDFSTLVAPDFLVAERAHGVLTDVVTAGEGTTVSVLTVDVPDGRRLTLAFRSHLVTGADLGYAGPDRTVEAPRDEHSRPLRVAYGFAVLDARLIEPAEADLAQALDTVLEVYRRFLADEEGFTVGASTPFHLRSRPAKAPTVVGRASSFNATRLAPVRQTGGPLMTGTLVLAAVAITGLLFQSGVVGGDQERAKTPPPKVIPTATTTPAATSTRTRIPAVTAPATSTRTVKPPRYR